MQLDEQFGVAAVVDKHVDNGHSWLGQRPGEGILELRGNRGSVKRAVSAICAGRSPIRSIFSAQYTAARIVRRSPATAACNASSD